MLSVTRLYGLAGEGVWAYSPAWIDSLTRLVQQLRGSGAHVLVLGPIPNPRSMCRSACPVILTTSWPATAPRSTVVNEAGIAAEAAATKASGGQYDDLTELFCAADRCPVIVGNTLVYRDQVHLTRDYSLLLAPVIGALADRALISS